MRHSDRLPQRHLQPLCLALVAALAGCPSSDDTSNLDQNTDLQTADIAALSTEAAAVTAGFLGILALPLANGSPAPDDGGTAGDGGAIPDGGSMPDQGVPADPAALAVATAATRFVPVGCATATVAGNVVSLVLANCAGPFGITHATGSLTVAVTGATSTIALSGLGTKVNGVVIDLAAKASISTSGGKSTLTVTTTGGASGLRKAVLTQSGTFTAALANPCITVDGSLRTMAGAVVPSDMNFGTDMARGDGANWNATLTGYHRCGGKCPDAGTSVIVSDNGLRFTLTFDGTPSSGFTSSSGNTGQVALTCSNAS